MVVSVVICVVGLVVSSLVSSVLTNLGDEDFQLEAQMLAADVKEYTKYLLSYEKIIFVDNPLRIEADRRNKMISLWNENILKVDYSDSTNFANTCGGFEFFSGFLGTLSLGGHRVFCPSVFRQPDLSSKELEDMYFDNWSQKSRSGRAWRNSKIVKEPIESVFELNGDDGTPLPQGWYRIKLRFDAIDRGTAIDKNWFLRNENMIPLYVGQRLFDFHNDPSMPLDVSAESVIDFYTDSLGFRGTLSERFVKVTSTVSFKRSGSGGFVRTFVDSESFILRTPTLKDFSLFIAYPTDKNMVPSNSPVWSKSMQLSPRSHIRGRVFFNGDIDVPLDALPQFYDTVFISGRLTTPIPAADMPKFRSKFRRGIVTNFSAARNIFDGKCSKASNINILNGSGIPCKDANGLQTLDAYPGFAASACKCYPLKFVSGRAGQPGRWEYQNQASPGVPCEPMTDRATCNMGLGTATSSQFLSTGMTDFTVEGPTFILAAIKRLIVNKPGSVIYGTVIGGYMSAPQGVDIFPLTEMKAGLPGIGNSDTLTQLSNEANLIGGGVTAPLSNMPLIQISKDGFK